MLLYKNTFTLLLFHAFMFSFICIETLLFFYMSAYLNVDTFILSYFYTLCFYTFMFLYFYSIILLYVHTSMILY